MDFAPPDCHSDQSSCTEAGWEQCAECARLICTVHEEVARVRHAGKYAANTDNVCAPALRCCSNVGRSRQFATATSTSTGVDSGTAAAAMGQHRLQLLVDALAVEPLNQLRHWQLEDFTDAEQSGHSDGATGLHLLPVAGGEAERQHVLLRIVTLLA
jgi:hypothetical protein